VNRYWLKNRKEGEEKGEKHRGLASPPMQGEISSPPTKLSRKQSRRPARHKHKIRGGKEGGKTWKGKGEGLFNSLEKGGKADFFARKRNSSSHKTKTSPRETKAIASKMLRPKEKRKKEPAIIARRDAIMPLPTESEVGGQFGKQTV